MMSEGVEWEIKYFGYRSAPSWWHPLRQYVRRKVKDGFFQPIAIAGTPFWVCPCCGNAFYDPNMKPKDTNRQAGNVVEGEA